MPLVIIFTFGIFCFVGNLFELKSNSSITFHASVPDVCLSGKSQGGMRVHETFLFFSFCSSIHCLVWGNQVNFLKLSEV